MAIFNDKNRMGINSTVFVQMLPDQAKRAVSEYIKHALDELDRRGDAFRTDALSKDEAYDDAMNSRLVDLVDLIGWDAIDDVMEKWAVSATFDPDRVVVPKAAWLLQDENGKQVVFEAHLAPNTISPVGAAWKTQSFEYNDEVQCWERVSRGVVFDCKDASDIVPPEAPRCHRLPLDWLEAHGVGVYGESLHGTLFNETELSVLPRLNAYVEAADIPRFPSFERLMEHPSDILPNEWEMKVGKYDLVLDIDDAVPGDVDCILTVSVPGEPDVLVSAMDHMPDAVTAYELCKEDLLQNSSIEMADSLPYSAERTLQKAIEKNAGIAQATWLYPHPSEFKQFEANTLGKTGYLWSDPTSPAIVVAIKETPEIWSFETTTPDGETALCYGNSFGEAYVSNHAYVEAAFGPTGIRNPGRQETPFRSVSELKSDIGEIKPPQMKRPMHEESVGAPIHAEMPSALKTANTRDRRA